MLWRIFNFILCTVRGGAGGLWGKGETKNDNLQQHIEVTRIYVDMYYGFKGGWDNGLIKLYTIRFFI